MYINTNTNRYITHLAVMEKLQDFYGITLHERIVQEMVYDCLLDLGRLLITHEVTCIDIQNYMIDASRLPCNLYQIISITEFNPKQLVGEVRRGEENFVEQIYGIFVDYVFDDKGLHFNRESGKVCIEWKGIKVNEHYHILFDEDLLNVCVAYCVYRSDYAKFRSGQIAPAIYQESMRIYQEEFQKARRTKFNRNYLDKAIKTLLSWNANRYFY